MDQGLRQVGMDGIVSPVTVHAHGFVAIGTTYELCRWSIDRCFFADEEGMLVTDNKFQWAVVMKWEQFYRGIPQDLVGIA